MGLVSSGLACRAPLIALWCPPSPSSSSSIYLAHAVSLHPRPRPPLANALHSFFPPDSLSSFITCSAGGEQVSVTGRREAAGSWATPGEETPLSSKLQPAELHFAFRLKWFVERMPGPSKKDRRGRAGGWGANLRMATVTQRVMDYCTTGNNVLSHLGKLLSRLGDFEIH